MICDSNKFWRATITWLEENQAAEIIAKKWNACSITHISTALSWLNLIKLTALKLFTPSDKKYPKNPKYLLLVQLWVYMWRSNSTFISLYLIRIVSKS